MAQLEPLRDEVAKLGAQLVYVAAEKRDGLFKPSKFLEEHPMSCPFRLDEERVVTRAYGLYHFFGRDAINIAHPATLLVDREGTVRYLYRGENQHDRAPIEPVLELLKQIRS